MSTVPSTSSSFEYRKAQPDQPLGLDGESTLGLAGGTDLLPLHKLGLVSPGTLVDLKTSGLGRSVDRREDGWRIGALTTLADVEDHAELAADLPVVKRAVSEAATRQLRNRATIGGNLLQQPRCRYYRNEGIDCWFNGGSTCPARDGRNEHHAIFDTGPCIAVQPSDLASALVALDAAVEFAGGESRPVAELLAAPTDDRRSLNRLGPEQAIDAVVIPTTPARHSAYRKVMARAGWAFALVGVAAVFDIENGSVSRARLVASGVAATPWRLQHAEEQLVGTTLNAEAIAAAGSLATEGAVDFGENGYKQPMLAGALESVLHELADGL